MDSSAPYYGQKDLAEFCEYVIGSLFSIPSAPGSPSGSSSSTFAGHGKEGIDTPPYTPPVNQLALSTKPEPPVLVEFIAYALYRTRLPISIVWQSLLLLSRLKQRYPSARGTSSSPHRLFLSSLMLSAKISMDDTYSNKSWAIVGSNYFQLKEVNQMERELFAFLGWNVVVSKEELDEFVASAEASWHQQIRSRALQECSKKRKIEEAAAREARHAQAKNAARALLRPHTYRHQSPSPIRSLTSAASSRSSSAAASPYASYTSSPHHGFGRMHIVGESSASSSNSSSAFPSASHSPTSPASAPLSAGPQTPEQDHVDVAPHHTHISQMADGHPDFPEAATYVFAKRQRSSSPSRGRVSAAN